MRSLFLLMAQAYTEVAFQQFAFPWTSNSEIRARPTAKSNLRAAVPRATLIARLCY
jgi:hypothetical protein